MSKEMERILTSPTMEAESAKGLAQLYRIIWADRRMNAGRLNALMQHWLNNPRNRVPNHGKWRSSIRGNMMKELSRPDMTWNVFRNGIALLRPLRAEFSVRLFWLNGDVTEHSIAMDIESVDSPDMSDTTINPDTPKTNEGNDV